MAIGMEGLAALRRHSPQRILGGFVPLLQVPRTPHGGQPTQSDPNHLCIRPVIAATLRPTLSIPPLRYGRGRLGASLRLALGGERREKREG